MQIVHLMRVVAASALQPLRETGAALGPYSSGTWSTRRCATTQLPEAMPSRLTATQTFVGFMYKYCDMGTFGQHSIVGWCLPRAKKGQPPLPPPTWESLELTPTRTVLHPETTLPPLMLTEMSHRAAEYPIGGGGGLIGWLVVGRVGGEAIGMHSTRRRRTFVHHGLFRKRQIAIATKLWISIQLYGQAGPLQAAPQVAPLALPGANISQQLLPDLKLIATACYSLDDAS